MVAVLVLTPVWGVHHTEKIDGQRHGSLPHGQSYCLQPVSRADEGSFLFLLWSGDISEWELHSYTVRLRSSLNPAGFYVTSVKLTFHVFRLYEHYLYKLFIPCIILTLAAFCLQLIPIESDSGLGDRIQCAFTMFRKFLTSNLL